MHPRNIYRHKAPDFLELAEVYPKLKKHLIISSTKSATSTLSLSPAVTIDFQNEESQRCLTEALLYRDFGLKLQIPSDRLCPPVPNRLVFSLTNHFFPADSKFAQLSLFVSRLNYVLWIQDIVRNTQITERELSPTSQGMERHEIEMIRGVDIGTGSSAIYPLLACVLEPSWRMYASGSEIDRVSLVCAEKNISDNNLQDRIELIDSSCSSSSFVSQSLATGSDDATMVMDDEENPREDCNSESRDIPILWPLFLHSDVSFYFAMCNPPFYSSIEDIEQSAKGKMTGPNAVCTGAEVEMITPGGESEFVMRMMEESRRVGTRCRWFTSMLGKLSSIEQVVDLLKVLKIHNYAITEFVQGQTRRWAVAWSFIDVRLPDSIARISYPNQIIQRCLPARNTFQQTVPVSGCTDTNLATEALRKILMEILRAVYKAEFWEVKDGAHGIQKAEETHKESYFVLRVEEDTWSRSARRKLQQQQLEKGAQETDTSASNSDRNGRMEKSGAVCTIHVGLCDENNGSDAFVEFNWRRGREEDRTLFQSLCSHLSRKILQHWRDNF
ncbi:hypothetical protein D9758_006506 [Tetrapyrgos nigripes]|uniref:U6 small nuclear RNA (adenine-(43)-N(6))-methyltransferase n=1 Tax=Tetrapyrgos nigripes TaxID=182062 RepID=A0A8H5GLC9_9AGAR|nr:hypothetical protein D9758_006506 [Tetrapyrgos nigripes]